LDNWPVVIDAIWHAIGREQRGLLNRNKVLSWIRPSRGDVAHGRSDEGRDDARACIEGSPGGHIRDDVAIADTARGAVVEARGGVASIVGL